MRLGRSMTQQSGDDTANVGVSPEQRSRPSGPGGAAGSVEIVESSASTLLRLEDEYDTAALASRRSVKWLTVSAFATAGTAVAAWGATDGSLAAAGLVCIVGSIALGILGAWIAKRDHARSVAEVRSSSRPNELKS